MESARADSSAVSTYASTAATEIAAFNLNWTVWPNATDPVPPYRANLTGYGQSHQLKTCNGTCGAQLLVDLLSAAQVSAAANNVTLHLCESTVTGVSPSGAGYIVESSNASMISNSIIFGTGGTGHLLNETHILANSDNDGIHLQVASDLGLALSDTNLAWHLEFENNNGTGWTERWFPLTSCAPNATALPQYDRCADYSTRSLALAAAGGTTDGVSITNPCGGTWWDTYFSAYGGLYSQPCPSGSQLAAGVIDRKDGFKVNETTMASVTAPRLFAAGTASASLLGDTYYAPGSTIGWALYSGRVAGRSAALIPVDPTPDETLSASAPLVLFVVATSLIFLGITAHVAKLYKTHYALMSTSVILVWVAAILAACASPRRQPAGQAHRTTGWAVATLITVNAMLGIARSVKKPGYVMTGYLHRLVGLLTIVTLTVHLAFITNEFSIGPDATRLYAAAYETFAGAMAILFALLSIVVAWNISKMRLAPAASVSREMQFLYVSIVNDTPI